jgi:hypothetical protein
MHTIHVKFCYYSSSLFRYSPRCRYRMDSCVRTSLPSRQGRQLRSLLFFKMLLLWDLWLKPTAPAPLPLPHDTSGCLLFTFPSALRLGVKELHALPLFAYPPPLYRSRWLRIRLCCQGPSHPCALLRCLLRLESQAASSLASPAWLLLDDVSPPVVHLPVACAPAISALVLQAF